jgi:hypothetical protein
MDKKLFGLGTGIGSMPHQQTDPALRLIFKSLSEIPHWPQLPTAGEEEGFIRQYLSPLIERGLVIEAAGRSPFFQTDAADWLERLTEFYTEVLAGQDDQSVARFAFPPSAATGFYSFIEQLRQEGTGDALYLKGQLSGPVTMGFQVTDEKMQPSFYQDELRDILVRSLALQIRWQARTLASFGLPVILFIDDPSIYGYGQSTFVGLSREAIQQSLIPLIEAAKDEGALVGVHACAGVDWSLLFELPFDFVNIDVYHYFTSLLVYTREFNSYLARGSALAWGIVPTSAEIESESAESILAKLEEQMLTLEKKGIDSGRLRSQLLFTPSCGTGSLSVAHAENVYRILLQISQQYRKR